MHARHTAAIHKSHFLDKCLPSNTQRTMSARVYAWVTLALALSVLAVLVTSTVQGAPRQPPQALAAYGQLELADLNALPDVVLRGQAPRAIVVSGTTSALTAPDTWPARAAVQLQLGHFSLTQVCNAFAQENIGPQGALDLGEPVRQNDGEGRVVLGVGPAAGGSSAFLSALHARGATGFTVTERLGAVTLFWGVLQLPCLPWCWSALEGSGETASSYAIRLVPSPVCPWTRAVLNVGQWHSVLPGAMADDGNTFDLRTADGCSINVNSGTFVLAPSSDTCTLGLSCLAWNSACTVDLANWRFGMSNLAIGRVVRNSSTYTFS